MKRFLIIFALAMTSMVCNAQIRYMGTTNVTGGQWCKFSGALTAQKCMSMSSDPLEKQFMYKCRIVNPAVTTIYFDL